MDLKTTVLCLPLVVLLLTVGFLLPVQAAPGDLDPTFGSGGKVTTAIGTRSDEIYTLALQVDGKIIAGGYLYKDTDIDFALVRYNTDGTLDMTFGVGGKITTGFSSTSDDYGYAVALQGDGKIVLAGRSGKNAIYDFALARYNKDGPLDTSFGISGLVTTDFGNTSDWALSIALQTDDKIVLCGWSYDGSNTDFALTRYNPDGSLDTTFGNQGIVTTRFDSGYALAYSLALQKDGKLVAAGYTDTGFALARYNADGTIDTSFGVGGKVTTGFGTRGFALALQTDDKIVIAGHAGSTSVFALARFGPDGTMDSGFGNNGSVTTPIGLVYDEAHALAIQADGKIVAVGFTEIGNGNRDFALTRYNPDGSLDTSFGIGGKVTTDFGPGTDWAYALAIQSDGKLVGAGYADNNNDWDFALARYLGNSMVSGGDNDNKDSGCFIATAAYGSYLAPEVQILRKFRGEYLLTNSIGRGFVKLYYEVSPPIANVIRDHEAVRAVTRWILTPVVYSVLYPGVFILFVSGTTVIVLASRRLKSKREW